MKILFFASLRERLQCDQETLNDVTGISTAQDIVDLLIQRGAPWNTALENGKLLVSINQEMASMSSAVNADDEIAFFPPVTGG